MVMFSPSNSITAPIKRRQNKFPNIIVYHSNGYDLNGCAYFKVEK